MDYHECDAINKTNSLKSYNSTDEKKLERDLEARIYIKNCREMWAEIREKCQN